MPDDQVPAPSPVLPSLRVSDPEPETPPTVDPVPLVAGTSLWQDAMRRLVRNKAAVAGAGVVLFMAITALLLEPISRYVTRFTYDEMHLAVEPKPMGAQSVPQVHARLDASVPFATIDTDGNGALDAAELSEALQRQQFVRYDADASGAIDARELMALPVNLGPNAADRLDADGNGTFTLDELRSYLDVWPESEARFFIRQHAAGPDDGTLSRAEFPGLPRPETHWLGTDPLGRDMLTRLVMGARVSIMVGFIATLVSFFIGILWGATAGFLGGRIDNWMMRFVDVLYGLPFLFLVILLMVIFQDIPAQQKLYLLFLALGAVGWLTVSRIVRGQVISLKENEYVEAARAIGVSKITIIVRHLIPNALGPIIVYATLTVPAVMLAEAFLSFLGLGVQAPYASWGSLAADGADAFREYPWLIIWPGSALAVTLLALNFLGDGMRDALDPQMRTD
jgi:oligopeptide transport system permease protein